MSLKRLCTQSVDYLAALLLLSTWITEESFGSVVPRGDFGLEKSIHLPKRTHEITSAEVSEAMVEFTVKWVLRRWLRRSRCEKLLRKRQRVEKNRMEGNAMAERHWERCVEGGERDHYGVFWGERVVLRRGDDV